LPESSRRHPRPGDVDYLERLFAAFEADHLTPDERRQLSGLHELLTRNAT
jgi:hypothetical protein